MDELKGIPDEFEGVCRDLWAMHLSFQQDLLPPIEEQDDTDGPGELADDTFAQSSAQRIRKRSELQQRASQAEMDALADEEAYESEQRDEELRAFGINSDEEGTSDGERQAWSHETVEDASQADVIGELAPMSNTVDARRSRQRARRRRTAQDRHEMLSLISILYLALLALKIPIQWTDILQLISAGRLPFLHALYALPSELVSQLPKTDVAKLDQCIVPDICHIYQHTLKFSTDICDYFDVSFPPINSPPIIWRCVEGLLLPPPFYIAATELLHYLCVPLTGTIERCTAFDLPSTSDAQIEPRLRVTLSRLSSPRDVVIMASVVVVAKIQYGLDGASRRGERHRDPISCAPSLKDWLAGLRRSRADYLGDSLSVYDPHTTEVLDLNDEQLDSYLAFAEKLFVQPLHPRIHHWRKRDNIADMLGCAPEVAWQHPLPEAGDNISQDNTRLPPLFGTVGEKREKQIKKLYCAASPDARDSEESDGGEALVPGEAYTIYHPTEERAALAAGKKKAKDTNTAPRRRGRPRKVASSSSLRVDREAADFDANSSHSVPVHPHFQQVLEFASQLAGCSMRTLQHTVYQLEVSLVKTLEARKKARDFAVRREHYRSIGKRGPGRPAGSGKKSAQAASQAADESSPQDLAEASVSEQLLTLSSVL
jgi:hypothetical protein